MPRDVRLVNQPGRSAPRGAAPPPAVCLAQFEPSAFWEIKTMLSIGQRVTLLKIDEMLAMTHRYEMEVRQMLDAQPVGYEGRKTRLAVIRERGKRKDFYLDMAKDDILLDGWGLPFQTDTETSGVFAGNACYNLVGEPEAIRYCIETRAVVPVSNDAKAKIIVARGERTRCDDEGLALLYPDIETHHAVVNRMKRA
jgi:hypothetical protein